MGAGGVGEQGRRLPAVDLDSCMKSAARMSPSGLKQRGAMVFSSPDSARCRYRASIFRMVSTAGCASDLLESWTFSNRRALRALRRLDRLRMAVTESRMALTRRCPMPETVCSRPSEAASSRSSSVNDVELPMNAMGQLVADSRDCGEQIFR